MVKSSKFTYSTTKSVVVKMMVALLAVIMVLGMAGVMPRKAYAASLTEEEKEMAADHLIHLIENSSEKLYVIDAANIFTPSEEERLTEKCKKTSKNCETDIVIITMKTGKDYSEFDNFIRGILEEHYGYNGTGVNSEAIIYGIDMVSRADRIITSGKTRSDISQSDLDDIRISAEEELAEGDYYDGCVNFIEGVELQMNNSFWFEFTLFWPIKLIIAAVIALVAVLIMMSSAKSRITVDSRTYSGNGFKMHRQEDRFINTTVRTRKIESSSSSSGGGGGGGGNSGSSGGHF